MIHEKIMGFIVWLVQVSSEGAYCYREWLQRKGGSHHAAGGGPE